MLEAGDPKKTLPGAPFGLWHFKKNFKNQVGADVVTSTEGDGGFKGQYYRLAGGAKLRMIDDVFRRSSYSLYFKYRAEGKLI